MAACDPQTSLAELKSRILDFARERDWEQFHSPKNLAMAMAAEAGELLEHFLWQGSEESRLCVDDPSRLEQIRQELADIFIFGLELANMTGIDVARAIEDKMAINARKYPVEKAKGRSAKYTEL